MNATVYIIEDEQDILELQKLHLQLSSFDVEGFSEASSFFKKIKISRPDIIILDLMLPDINGLEVCKRLRSDISTKDIPIIMVTARNDTTDKIVGLELGADDYITKPFDPKELVARVRAVLRRFESSGNKQKNQYKDEHIEIQYDRRRLLINEIVIDLTNKEFRILEMLSKNQGKVCSREHILNKVWGQNTFVVDRTVDVHIRHLRKKMNVHKDYIKNIRGAGYLFEKP